MLERENLAAVENEDDFPTAELLRRANDEYYTSHKARNKENKYENGLPIPVPARKRKEEVFRIENYEELDRKACDVSSICLSHCVYNYSEEGHFCKPHDNIQKQI